MTKLPSRTIACLTMPAESDSPAIYSVETYSSQDSALYQMNLVRNRFVANLDMVLADRDITISQWGILKAIADHRVNTAADIVRIYGHDAGALTRMLDRLEDKGLIMRHRSQSDRRCVTLSVTPAGLHMMEVCQPLVVRVHNAAMAGITQEDHARLLGYLQQMQRNLGVTCPSAQATVSTDASQ